MSDISKNSSIEQLNQLVTASKVTYKQMFEMNSSIEDSKAIKLIDDALNNTGKTIQQIGKAMEDLVQYFLMNSGFVQNVTPNNKNKLHEIDHYAEISPHLMSYFNGKGIDKINFVGESKNYGSSLSVDKIYKLESIKMLTKSKLGAYFTKFGLKGEIDSSAKGVLADFYHKCEHVSLVFTIEDWNFLKTNPQKFPALFYDKFANFQATYDSEETDHKNL